MKRVHPCIGWGLFSAASGFSFVLASSLLLACGPSRPPRTPAPEVSTGAPRDQPAESAVALTSAVIDVRAPASVEAAPSENLLEHVRLVGRFDTTDAGGPLIDWSGGRILARFRGDGIAAWMTDIAFNGGHARWDVTIDGRLQTPPLTLLPGRARYVLAAGLPQGDHSLELWKRTEANVSTTQLHRFDVSHGELLAPPPAPTRRLEFLGDSVSAGFGVLGKGPNCAFSPTTEDDHVAFPALVAESLGADHQNLAYSGRGIFWNYDRKDPGVLPLLYLRTRATAPASAWNFDAFVPDVVWITLGGNDWDQPHPGDPPPPLREFEDAYDKLVTTVREKHPNALIVCAIAPSLNDYYPSKPPYSALFQMRTALGDSAARARRRGDTRVVTFEFARAAEGDLTGCGGHPNAKEQRALAGQAIAFIKAQTGWGAEGGSRTPDLARMKRPL
jgi:lysophospholipase L1-like esterase